MLKQMSFLAEFVYGETAFLLIRDDFTDGFRQKTGFLCFCFLLSTFLTSMINYG